MVARSRRTRPSGEFLYIAIKSCPRGRDWPCLGDFGCAGGEAGHVAFGVID